MMKMMLMTMRMRNFAWIFWLVLPPPSFIARRRRRRRNDEDDVDDHEDEFRMDIPASAYSAIVHSSEKAENLEVFSEISFPGSAL